MGKKKSQVPFYSVFQLVTMVERFGEKSREFAHIMGPNGGGIQTISLLDLLNEMTFLYLKISALLNACQMIDSEMTLEKAKQIVEDFRKREKEGNL